MDVGRTPSIDSVLVIDASKWNAKELQNKLHSLSKKQKDGELCLITTLPIKASLENFPEGQVLTIAIDGIRGVNDGEVDSLLESLGQLRDHYPDITVRVIDNADQLSTKAFPQDTIIKKSGEQIFPLSTI